MVNDFYQKKKFHDFLDLANKKEHSESKDKNNNEKSVYLYVNVEKNKTKFESTIADEYNEKIILYGYLIVSLLILIRTLINVNNFLK